MASATLTANDRFPAGATVAAYPESNWPPHLRPPSGAPVGASTASAVVSAAGVAALSGLADDTRYVAYSLVGSEHRYVAFSTQRKGVSAERVLLPNVTITDEANPSVNAVQFGEDGAGVLKGQHLTTADQTGEGQAAEMTVNPGAANGTNQPGAPLRLSGGISTGSGAPGPITFLHTTAGASGTTPRTQTDRWYMTDVSGFSVFYPATDDIAFIGLASNQINTLYVRNVIQRGYHEFAEMVAPAAGAANTARLFSRDNGAGKTQLCVIFPTGAIQVLSTEP
jgi:hypothetical protein